MVFDKIKDLFSNTSEKYEVLYYKYSKLKIENQKLKEKVISDVNDSKIEMHRKLTNQLINLYEDVETAKASSFKVPAVDKDMQRFLMDVNKIERELKKILDEYNIEEIIPHERFYDPEFHEVASYSDAQGMAKGMILKTVKKGFKYKNQVVKKPKVVVTK